MFKKLDELKKKKIYTIVAVILLAAMYLIIFKFSSENAEESSGISRRIAGFIYKIYYQVMGISRSGEAIGEVILQVSPLEAFIRKLAHFTEYLCVGLLSYRIVSMWYQPKWKGRMIVLLQVFLSGALDEIHQYFVPGRYASFKDVLLDTAGGVTGIILLSVWLDVRKKIRDN